MLLNEIAKSVAEKIDNEIAKAFVSEAGQMLINQGIRLYIDYQKVDEEVIEDENKSEYHTTYNIKFAGIDTSEHDKQIREDANKTVSEIIEEVCNEICDNYCKYREKLDENMQDPEKHCDNCPLNRLG